ncbi:MAG: penicillin acylase family protein, partial [Burkholderiaceae bacterium]
MHSTRRRSPLWAAASLALLLTACGGSSNTTSPGGDTPVNPPVAVYKAEVRRTSFGVPHVKADNEKGLGYGIGYAFAQDNFCVLADMIVTVNGERSKYFGPTATYDSSGGHDVQTNLSSDFYHKYLNDPQAVQATWDRQPTEIKDLTEGYVAGINRYLKDTGVAGLADACKNQPWVRPLTTLDLMRLQRRYAVTASGANFMDALYAAQPPAAAPAPGKAQAAA